MLSRDRSMPLDTLSLSGTQGNVFGNLRSMFDSSQTPYQGILHYTNPGATGAIPVQLSTGRLVARSEERLGSTTPMPVTSRRPSTRNSLFQEGGYPQNCMVDQQKLQIPTGTDQTRTSRMENGMMSLNTCCWTSANADIPYSVEPVLWNEEL